MRNRHHFRIRYLLVLPLALVLSSSGVVGQDFKEDKKPEELKSREEKEREQRNTEVLLGKKFLSSSDAMMRGADRRLYQMNYPDNPPTTFVDFGPSQSSFLGSATGSYRIHLQSNYWYRTFAINDLASASDSYVNGDIFVLSGYITPNDEQWFRANKFNYVIESTASPKELREERSRAAALAFKRFTPGEIVIVDALPHETNPTNSRIELKRMGLEEPTPGAWHDAREEIRAATVQIATEVATKELLENELRLGTRNVVFLMAHAKDQYIYFPGLHGGRLSMEQLNEIHRDSAPDRIVVLLACKAGRVNGKTRSIAEVILKNKLATAVMGTDDYVYAESLGEMLRNFQRTGFLSVAFPNLRTIVELKTSVQSDSPIS